MDGACATTKLAIHHMRKKGKRGGGGSIVLTASLAGYLASAGAPLYSAAKHGVVGLMRALKQECAKLNISISVVAPGITVTPILTANNRALTAASPDVYVKQMREAGVPINTVESVALAVCWLLNEGRQANGAGIFVQADRFLDLERGLAKSREVWMGKDMLDLFRRGRTAPMFERLGEEKSGSGSGSESVKAKI
ncbi:hypothetical protein GMOD_00006006 [Pyrenophora seminiperda CCB06]|uniref:Uncharacterized protein n=1 Tax=Pyrenophora seminiperda CCB06 TaxID=1302712 RepID=A0A3M7M468_9PLEO|nr:hypothetical protein GMOD_00006006 [Pyrenophora seminiperda CCB06]